MDLQELTNIELSGDELYLKYRDIKLKISVIDLLICDIEDNLVKLSLRGREDTRAYLRNIDTKKSLLSISADYKYYLYRLEEILLDRGYFDPE